MRELIQVRDAVITALQKAELPALTAFPAGRAKQYGGPIAVVGVGAAEGKTMGFCNYLGESYDASAGTVRELYGKQLEAEISVDIRGSRAALCEDGCETAADVLLSGLPEGIRPGELRWEALKWEKETGMFLRQGYLRCRAAFIAQDSDDSMAFLDFQLKGVLKT
ncbi:hypothetical protein SAMN05216343_10453 [Oscillibacter sp. PC13]|uniref:hypothetical protein n=1 Tax=Oscillibacter sp. PC13 TaxID=1855299 RepID=UPI0008E72766|nr:hypothetical protein [Oscillibacter sp. PC13]SFP19261.1 hypothetical protein SAMN05216343_10453 [Oscillibacter sp. PC13]